MYADTGAPVENTTDDEAPLLSSYDGTEFSSCERPSKFLLGRASFKLRISQVKIPCMNIAFIIPRYLILFTDQVDISTLILRIWLGLTQPYKSGL